MTTHDLRSLPENSFASFSRIAPPSRDGDTTKVHGRGRFARKSLARRDALLELQETTPSTSRHIQRSSIDRRSPDRSCRVYTPLTDEPSRQTRGCIRSCVCVCVRVHVRGRVLSRVSMHHLRFGSGASIFLRRSGIDALNDQDPSYGNFV